MKTYLRLVFVALFLFVVNCDIPEHTTTQGMDGAIVVDLPDVCGIPQKEEDLEERITASYGICNDCWRKFGGPNSSCGAEIIAIGSCVADPKISYYKLFGPQSGSLWYKGEKLLAAQTKSIGTSGQILSTCQSEAGPPCLDFKIEIVWCR